MSGSKRTFEYVIEADPEVVPRIARRARERACESNSQVECHGIEGEALGLVIMKLTVTGRDQWACRQIVQDILNFVTWGLTVKITKQDLRSRRQPPHTHRGYLHGRTKRFREPRPQPPPAPRRGQADSGAPEPPA